MSLVVIRALFCYTNDKVLDSLFNATVLDLEVFWKYTFYNKLPSYLKNYWIFMKMLLNNFHFSADEYRTLAIQLFNNVIVMVATLIHISVLCQWKLKAKDWIALTCFDYFYGTYSKNHSKHCTNSNFC